jgi:hypothetical protein
MSNRLPSCVSRCAAVGRMRAEGSASISTGKDPGYLASATGAAQIPGSGGTDTTSPYPVSPFLWGEGEDEGRQGVAVF